MKYLFLVEDNPDNAEYLMDLLSDRYEFKWVTNANEGLECLEGPDAVTPDIFLLDISLPGMDGVTLLGKIRLLSAFKKIPAIALTAHAMSTDRKRFIDAGFNGYITKPIVDEKDLVEEIERLTNPE